MSIAKIMKIKLLYIGKEDSASLDDAVKSYVGKIKFYLPFEVEAIPYLKNTKLSVDEQKKQEGQLFLKKIETSDFGVLLEQQMVRGTKRLVFLIGGAYGFSEEVYARGNYKIALSQMTFPHILTRLIFAEQLYRAMTIWKGEPYHHV